MKYILDSSFFFGDYQLDGDCFVSPLVVDELKDTSTKLRFEVLKNHGLVVCEPNTESISKVCEKAKNTGDLPVLSDTDINVISLGLYLNGTVVSDDFAVQNVCLHLNIPVKNILQKRAKSRVWKHICSGCRSEIPVDVTECPICGHVAIERNHSKNKLK